MPAPDPGHWEVVLDSNNDPINSLVTAVHANLIPVIVNPGSHPEGKVLYWHGRYITNFDDGGKIVSCVYDPETKEIIQYTVPVWPVTSDPMDPSKIFCSGHIQLADGKILTAGGERNIPPVASRGIKYSFIFDQAQLSESIPRPWRNTETGSPPEPTMMSKGRWYPQLTRLQNGNVVAISGYKYESQTIEERHELFDWNTETWTEFDESGDLEIPLYNGAYLLPFGSWQGEIFYDLVSFGPVVAGWTKAHRFKLDILSPVWNTVGSVQGMRHKGNSVMMPFNANGLKVQIINLGGYGEEKTAQMIEVGVDLLTDWVPLADMNQNRHDAPNALLLADGTLMVIGGGHDMETVLTPEYLDNSDPDPSNWTWIEMPDMEVPRKYHSTALLLPDASVWVGGSRIFTEPQILEYENDMERRIEIFKPGYLFEGPRPIIEEVPLEITIGDEPFGITLGIEGEGELDIDSFVLISMANITHCFDCNQRYVILDFDVVSPQKYEVTPPPDSFVTPPGYYMMFALNDK